MPERDSDAGVRARRVQLSQHNLPKRSSYEKWKANGAEFVTPPIGRGAEIRRYIRDPDGYLIEVGQATGVLHGKLAAKRPEDLPG